MQKFDERNKDIKVSVNGKLFHRNDAHINVFDSVVQGGDAVWEGLRLYQGKIFALGQHLSRMKASAHSLNFENVPNENEIRSAIITEV